MAWQLLVIRKDSPLRHQLAATGISDSADKCNFVNSPALAGIRLDRWWWDSDGSVHAHMGQLRALVGGFIRTFHEYPTFLWELSQRYRRVALRWLNRMEEIATCDLSALSNAELLQMFDDFCEGAIQSNIILMPPFAVERMHAGDEYRALLARLADELRARLTKEVREGNGEFTRFYLANIADIPSREELINKVASIVEFSSERTFAEQKEMALLRLAAEIQKEGPELTHWLLRDGPLPSREEMEEISLVVVREIDSLLEQFSWIKQWGYPPFYGPSAFEDFVAEIADKLRTDPTEKYRHELVKQEMAMICFENFRRHVSIGEMDLALIETINEYNFLRTWRMEVVMRCQYLSMPLLREIERRAIQKGKMQRDDIFLLTAPEIRRYLLEGEVIEGLSERRSGWVMIMRDGKAAVLVGADAKQERQAFYSVLDWRERARSRYGHEAATVGGKAENLYTLVDMKQPVPKFFVVTTEAYRVSLKENSLAEKLAEILERHQLVFSRGGITDATDAEVDYVTRLAEVEREVHSLFLQCDIPEHIATSIKAQADELELTSIAVRSSASVEDSPRLSWAGRFHSYTYVMPGDLFTKVKEVWASLYNSVALQYALEHGLDPLQLEMAVIVQEMLDPLASGVINTSWSLEVPDIMEIEAVWGQCAPLVSGEITPDTYLVRKDGTLEITEKRVVPQERQAGCDGLVPVSTERRESQKLSDKLIKRLAAMAVSVEKFYERPQDIEWALVGRDLFLVQTRPLTGADRTEMPSRDEVEEALEVELDAELILTGQKGKVSTRITGQAYVAETLEDAKNLNTGEIIVLAAATPNWDPILIRVAAIVANEGGATSHAVRVANERNLPAVVGTGKATKTIKSGDRLLIDTTEPFRGKVYRLPPQ